MSYGELNPDGNYSVTGLYHFEGDANDNSGNANHGTAYGSIALSQFGRFGQCYDFDMSNDYIRLPGAVVGKDEGTVSMWIYPHSVYSDSNNQFFFDTDTIRHTIYKNTSNSLQISNDARLSRFYISALWTQNNWHWVVMAYKKTADLQQLHWNGNEITAYSRSGTWGSNNVGTYAYIGSSIGAPANLFDGLIDDVCIWNRALSANEIRQLYAQMKGAYGIVLL